MSSSGANTADFDTILGKVRADHKTIDFKPSTTFYWSPAERVVHYGKPQSEFAVFSLLHELSHALLGHTTYTSDIELLQLEAAAWERASIVAKKYKVTISDDHVQDCLDTYREWLHKRSTCTTCKAHGIQIDPTTYTCINCNSRWSVTSARFCRVYRKTK